MDEELAVRGGGAQPMDGRREQRVMSGLSDVCFESSSS
jgi:hypothetical protein